jgi:prevent-host-death family protein
MHHAIQATEAKARLAELLRAVERGESFVITRHGKTIAHLLPASATDQQVRRDAVARFRARKAGWGKGRLSAQEILDARREGHRA